MIIRNMTAAVSMAAMLAMPIAARAQAAPGYGSDDETVRGTISSIEGKYTVYVRDQRGYVDTIHLHDGTIINPTGLELSPGQSVEIHGRTDGHAFDANEIDTPYDQDAQASTGDPGPGYATDDIAPDAGYVAPYPYYSYYPAYALSYPAFVSLGFGFGCCYGGYFGGYYGGGFYGHGYWGHGYGGYGGYGHGYGYGYGGRGYGYGYNGRGYGTTNAYGYRHTNGTTYGRSSYGGYSRSAGSYGGYSRSSYNGSARSAGSYGGYGRGGGYRSTSSGARASGGGGFHGGGASAHAGGGGHH